MSEKIKSRLTVDQTERRRRKSDQWLFCHNFLISVYHERETKTRATEG